MAAHFVVSRDHDAQRLGHRVCTAYLAKHTSEVVLCYAACGIRLLQLSDLILLGWIVEKRLNHLGERHGRDV